MGCVGTNVWIRTLFTMTNRWHAEDETIALWPEEETVALIVGFQALNIAVSFIIAL
jgi:hypothetical protein